MREVTPQGHAFIRKSSSKFYNEETIEMMFSRIISRRKHSNLRALSDQIEGTPAQKAKLIIWGGSIEEILQRCGMGLQIEKLKIELNKFPSLPGTRMFVSALDPKTGGSSALIFSDFKLITDSLVLEVLKAELTNFREELHEAVKE